MRHLAIEQNRPLPVLNATQGKDQPADTHYTTEVVERAKAVFGPYMRKWGYEFPPDWGKNQPSRFNLWYYQLLSAIRALYLTQFRYTRGTVGKAVRRLRSLF